MEFHQIKTSDDIDGEVAKMLRKRASLPQEEFWRSVGLSQESGSLCESGRTKTISDPVRKLIFIIYVIGLPLDTSTSEGTAKLEEWAKMAPTVKPKKAKTVKKKSVVKNRVKAHACEGGSKHPSYISWISMMQRCKDKDRGAYENYGARGIKVCARWETFDNFLTDMGVRPEGLTLDRIDNSKGYSPENCRWATRADQNRNQRTNALYEFGGKTMCRAEWSLYFGVNPDHLRKLVKEMGLVEAFTKMDNERDDNGIGK